MTEELNPKNIYKGNYNNDYKAIVEAVSSDNILFAVKIIDKNR